jgi:hypothetical protein
MTFGTGLNGAPEIVAIGEVASDGAIITPTANGWTGPVVVDANTSYYQTVQPATPGTNYAGGTYRMTITISGGTRTIGPWVKQ